MGWSNFQSWLSGDSRSRERDETREAWVRIEEQWRASPLAGEDALFDLTVALVRDVAGAASRRPATPMLIELCASVDSLLLAEDLAALEVNWRPIESDVAVAVDFRAMIRRRSRWVTDFDRMLALFRRQLTAGCKAIFDACPDACFEQWADDGGTFGVPLVELLERPAEVIERLLQSAYDDDTFRLELFLKLREGDLINKLVRLALFSPDEPDNLADRLVLIDPADVEFPAALNLFDAHLSRLRDYRPVDQERVLNGVIELYEMFFGALLGAELTQKQGVIFKYLARLMIAIEGSTIHTLMALMEDGKPFKAQMAALDGSARYFFENEFFDPSFNATKKQILKRLWGILSTPAFERMFAQKDNKLDLFAAMNEGKIVLVSTAKDLLKQDGSQLFGQGRPSPRRRAPHHGRVHRKHAPPEGPH